MGRRRYRQLLGLLAMLVLPALAIAGLAGLVLEQQSLLDQEHFRQSQTKAKQEDRDEASEIGANVRDFLTHLLEQGVQASPSDADGYSDPSIALVARTDGRKLALPWESDPPNAEPYVRASEELERITEDALPLTYKKKQPGQAVAMLQEELQKSRPAIQQDILKGLLRQALWESGRHQEADNVAVDMLDRASSSVNGAVEPMWWTAAGILVQEGSHEREVLSRVERDTASLAALGRWHGKLLEILETLRRSHDASVARDADAAIARLKRRMERLDQLRTLPQAAALKAAFPKLDATPGKWLPFPPTSGEWFVGIGPQDGDKTIAVAVTAADVAKIVQDDRKQRGLPRPFQFAIGDGDYPMGSNFPGWQAVPGPRLSDVANAKVEIAHDAQWQKWFYALTLLLVLGLAAFGGHMLWRDTQREVRLAELRSQFVSSVSHELKTPLTGIRMLAETLQIPGMSDSKTQAEYLETIVAETERLTRLLNNVLDFSKIERGQKSYHLEPASLSDVLNNVARTMRFPLVEQGFDFHMDVNSNVPSVRIDRDSIEQAVLNLISNAMKYSGESREIHLRLFAENGTARIQVTDRGIGIPPEELKRIFEKFYRVHTPENRAISGTGLGLALVAHIVEAHGGGVDVESTVGKGSTFTIRLPLDRIEAAASSGADAGASAVDAAPLSGETTL